jgi:peroxiredoxin
MYKILIFLFLLIASLSYIYSEKIKKGSSYLLNSSIFSSTATVKKFTFKSLNNREINIEVNNKKLIVDGFQNKIIFLKVFGWECQYCKKEIPELIELKNEFSDSFDVIALEAQKHSEKENREAIEKYKINYHIVSAIGHSDFYNYLKDEYNWHGVIPLTMIIGEGGEILAFEEGSKSYTLAGLLKMALEQRELIKQMK